MLLNIMFHAPMGRFQLELIHFIMLNDVIPGQNNPVYKLLLLVSDLNSKITRDNERPTGKKNTTFEWDDGERK